MKIRDLYSKIYIIKKSKMRRKKVYLTRNMTKKLNELKGNSKFSEYLMTNNAIKIPIHLLENIHDKLTDEFGLYVDKLKNSTIILPF